MIIALKKIMDEKSITAQELAEKTGLTKNMIWAYQSGRNKPDPETLCTLADALDVSLDILVRGKEKDRPKGRSVQEIMAEYRGLSEEEINLLVAVLQTELANRAFQARLRQGGTQNP